MGQCMSDPEHVPAEMHGISEAQKQKQQEGMMEEQKEKKKKKGRCSECGHDLVSGNIVNVDCRKCGVGVFGFG